METLQETLTRIERGELSTLEAIEALPGEELTTRQSRRMKMGLQTARLTVLPHVILLPAASGDVPRNVEPMS